MANNSSFTGIQPLRPPIGGPMGPPQNALPPMPMQFRPVVPAQQAQPYIPVASQQFQPVRPTNIGVPSNTQHLQFSQPQQQLPPRPVQAGYGLPPPQAFPMSDVQPNRLITTVSPQPLQNTQVPNSYMPGLGGPRLPFSSSYTLSTPTSSQLQINTDAATQYQPISQANVPNFPAGEQAWLSSGSQSIKPLTPVQQSSEHTPITVSSTPGTVVQSNPIEKGTSDWIEHTSRQGKRYYYNKKTRLSSWEKPLELMTAIERADASTEWREYTSPDGKKYYYNKVTKQSKWTIPDELKLVREQVKMEHFSSSLTEKDVNVHSPAVFSLAGINTSSPNADSSSSLAHGVVSSPIPVEPVAAINPPPIVTSGSSTLSEEASNAAANATESETPLETVTPTAAVSESTGASITLSNTILMPMNNSENISAQDVETSLNGVPSGDTEEAKHGTGTGTDGKSNITALDEKIIDQEPSPYENKLEAKNAFKALLETANVGSDWTWDQAMRAIINDRRYGALKTLSERKQTFVEFLGQKKKQEAEERRARLKKAREDFKKMLEEAKELTSSTRWSKAITMFEDDERFIAIERAKDREDQYEDHIMELEKKERAKALEQHRRNRMEYIDFLKSCDFIQASSQWRKVQDRLEADERCSRLQKIDRLEIFQEYIRDLEKEEEEQRKLQMEELRKAERRNRDEFRKLMEEHVAGGTLTAKTHWRDYCMKVKDLPAYLAVSSNTSGSTAKDLFEDVTEELEKQYAEDKARIKDAMKLRKVTLTSTWTLEDFKTAILEDLGSPLVSDANLKLLFGELQERVREKVEKEAKRRKRLADEFHKLLSNSKDITASSRWEDCKPTFEDRQERWSTDEENCLREIFEKHIVGLKEKAKEERRRREDKVRKDKEGKGEEEKSSKRRRNKEKGLEDKKEKERHRNDATDSENTDRTESHSLEESKRSGGDKDKKHHKRHSSSLDDLSLNESEKDRSKNSFRESDFNKSKQMEQHACTSEADHGGRYKRHKRDHRNVSHRNDNYEHKGRYSGEDGEVW